MLLATLVCVHPLAPVTFKETSYNPLDSYKWEGFCSIEVDPSPKFHSHATAPVELSVKSTVNGPQPNVGVAAKSAFTISTLITSREVEEQPTIVSVTVSVTVKSPEEV